MSVADLDQPGTGAAAGYRQAVAALAPRSAPWRLILGLGLCIAAWASATAALIYGYALVLSMVTGQSMDQAILSVATITSPGTLVAMLLGFAGATIGLAIAMRVLHKQPFAALFGGRDGARALCLGTMLLVLMSGILLAGLGGLLGLVGPGADVREWIVMVGPVVVAVFVQASAEEIAFRGYLQAHLAARYRSAWVWIGIPSVLFALIHLGNYGSLTAAAWLLILPPAVMGVMVAHLTVRTRSLWAAIGFHVANNLVALLLVSVPSPIGISSLYVYRLDLSDFNALVPLVLANLLYLTVAYVLVLRLVARQRPPIATAAGEG